MAPAALRAQDETPDGYVTRKEYEELKTELLALKKELDTLKKEREVAPTQKDHESQSVAAPPWGLEYATPGTSERKGCGVLTRLHG